MSKQLPQKHTVLGGNDWRVPPMTRYVDGVMKQNAPLVQHAAIV